MKAKLHIVFVMILAAFIFYGCATKTVKIDPIPELKIGSPLAGIQPLTFMINQFEDVRPYMKLIGDAHTHKIELDDQKVSEIVTRAFANEIKRNGHKVLQSKDTHGADVIIGGIVRQYLATGRDYFTGSKVTAEVEVEINVTSKGADKPLSKTYRGSYYTSPTFGINLFNMGTIFTDATNNALLNMLKEFTTDEEILDVLKEAKKKDL